MLLFNLFDDVQEMNEELWDRSNQLALFGKITFSMALNA